jgi:carbonic anhydrase
VKEKVDSGALTLHGWYFDLETGTLHTMDKNGDFAPAS